MADVNIDGVVTWLKNWFYDKTEIGTLLNAKANLNQNQANYNVVTDASGNITVEAKPTIPTDVNQLADSTGVIPTDVSDLTDTQNTAFTPKSHSHNQITNDGKITSSAVTVASGDNIVITDASDSSKIKRVANLLASHIKDSTAHSNIGSSANDSQDTINTKIDTALGGKASSSHTQTSSTITDTNTYSNIGNSSGTQDSINSAIDTKLGQLSNIDALIMVDTLPTASSSTMGKLYVINENSKINFYWTKRSGSSGSYTYAWEKMDTDILDELVVNWSDVQNKPSTFTPSSHKHGNITNDGIIEDDDILYPNCMLVTDINSKITPAFTLESSKITDSTAHSNIGSSANATQSTINTSIDTALSNKGAKTDDVDWTYNSNGFTNGVKLVSKSDNANGRITLHLKS